MSIKIYAVVIVLFLTPIFGFSQIGNSPNGIPLSTRNVLGIVQDSTKQSVIGASVTLLSKTDTLRTVTSTEGIFFFKKVQPWVFTIKVEALGFIPKIINGSYSDSKKDITLDPILLSTSSEILKTVIVNGTPTIIYKTDTIEYRAKDYVVRAGATIDELLKKMEGVDVEKDGTLSTNGQKVEKVKLNGREINGGSVAPTIRNLPADIVDKIQFIDDYGKAAEKTGIKDGVSEKVLNITTSVDKSVGNTLTPSLSVATQNQIEGNANYTRINKNQTLTANFSSLKRIAGLPNVYNNYGELGSAAFQKPRVYASAGTLGNINPSLSFNKEIKNKLKINFSYNLNNNRTDISTLGNGITNSILGTIINNRDNVTDGRVLEHKSRLILDYDIDAYNSFNYEPIITYTKNTQDRFNNLQQQGLIQQIQKDNNLMDNHTLLIKNNLLYTRLWKNNKSRSLSLNFVTENERSQNSFAQTSNILYFENGSLKKDSLLKNDIEDRYTSNRIRNRLTYTEPITKNSRLEFSQSYDISNYGNQKATMLTGAGQQLKNIDSLSNDFNYRFNQYNGRLNYQFKAFKNNLSATVGGNYLLSFIENKGNGNYNFSKPQSNIFPYLNLRYGISLTQSIKLYYQGSVLQPSFSQFQPIRDISNPQNNIIGNTGLKFGRSNYSRVDYNNYISYSKISYAIAITTVVNKDLVGTNILQLRDDFGSLKNETRYVNLNGNNSYSMDYNLTKQLNNRKYSLGIKGDINQNNLVFLSNNAINKAVETRYRQKLFANTNPTAKLEINPSILLDYANTSFSFNNANTVNQSILAFGLDSKLDLTESLLISVSLSKNYVAGIANNQNQNPLIGNLQLRNKFEKNNFSIAISAYDIFNQNKFVVRNVTPEGFSEILTNPNSRYVMLNFKMVIQKWTSAKSKNGEPLKRRGDGSFLN